MGHASHAPHTRNAQKSLSLFRKKSTILVQFRSNSVFLNPFGSLRRLMVPYEDSYTDFRCLTRDCGALHGLAAPYADSRLLTYKTRGMRVLIIKLFKNFIKIVVILRMDRFKKFVYRFLIWGF